MSPAGDKVRLPEGPPGIAHGKGLIQESFTSATCHEQPSERFVPIWMVTSAFLRTDPQCQFSTILEVACGVLLKLREPYSPAKAARFFLAVIHDRKALLSEQSPILEISQPAIELLAILLDMRRQSLRRNQCWKQASRFFHGFSGKPIRLRHSQQNSRWRSRKLWQRALQ